MTLGLAFGWTLVLITNIVGVVSGAAPTWVAVFCPVSALVFNCWIDYIVEKVNRRK
jgi:hypothetical protein